MTLVNYTEKKLPYKPHGIEWTNFVKKFFKKESEYSIKIIYAFDNRVPLKKELKAQLSRRNGYYYLDNEYLNLHCMGETIDSVLQEFSELFIADKENYYDCDENELSPSGMMQRKRLARYL